MIDMKTPQLLIGLFVLLAITFSMPCMGIAEVPVEVVSSVSQTIAAQNNTVHLDVSFLWEGAPDAIVLDFPRNPDCYLLEIEEIKQENFFALYPDQKLNRIRMSYTLRATEPGEGRISYIAFEYTESATGAKRMKKTEPIDITIMSGSRYLLRQTANAVSVVLVIAFIGAAVYFTVRIVRKKKRQSDETHSANTSMLDEWEKEALGKLQVVRKYKIAGDSYKFFHAMRTVLNDYFEERSHVSAVLDVGTAEQSIVLQNIKVEYKEIIAACNRIKFSGEQLTSEDLDRWYNRAVKLVSLYKEHTHREQTEKKMKDITLRDNGGA